MASDPSVWIKRMLPKVKLRAQKAGIEFSLKPSDISVPTHCPVLGIPLRVARHPGLTGANFDSPSLDRRENSKGYTPDNVCVISLRANLLKRDATTDEVRRILAYMEG